MTTVKLHFVNSSTDGTISMYFYDPPEKIQKKIIETLDLEGQNEFIISFSRFVDYNPEHHLRLLDEVFKDFPKNLQREVHPQGITYKLKEPQPSLESLPLDDLVFICALLHNLNLKKYLTPCIYIALNKYKIGFEEFKARSKDSKFTMNIFTR